MGDMRITQRQSACFALDVDALWNVLRRCNLSDLHNYDSYNVQKDPCRLVVTANPTSNGCHIVGATVRPRERALSIQCVQDGKIVRTESFVLHKITMQAKRCLLEWTTVHEAHDKRRADFSPRQFFHFLRDAANPKPRQNKVEDLLGCLLGQIKSKPSYLKGLAELPVSRCALSVNQTKSP